MASFKDCNLDRARKARAAWETWLDEKIRIPSPSWDDLVLIPAEPMAAAMAGDLPPGWEWVNGEPEDRSHIVAHYQDDTRRNENRDALRALDWLDEADPAQDYLMDHGAYQWMLARQGDLEYSED